MSIFRETFKTEISASLAVRQQAMARDTTDKIRYLNSRNSWIRMTSAVNTNVSTANPNGTNTLAKQYVLLGGTLNQSQTTLPGGTKVDVFALKAGVGNKTKAYSATSPSNKTNRLGIRPMPGITNIDVKSLSAYGSLREVTVNFQCWDIHQLEDLELLYMRPGYTVLIEWGWLPYLDNKGQLTTSIPQFYDILNKSNTKRSDIFEALHKKCLDSGGNYDAMYGYVKNYQWSARPDGGYDCQTTIISTGEVIESLKVNYVRADLANYNLYVSGSVPSFGFLQDVFTNQGNFNDISTLAGHYEKNVVAGVWAELFLKYDQGATPDSNIIPPDSIFKTTKFPGLISGDSNSTISPGNSSQIYITLDKVCDILNDYVIARSTGNSTGSSEPLVKLSTKLGKITHGSTDSLLCIAHPIQVSVDPSACLIKSPLWYNDVIPQVQSQSSGISASLSQVTDDIYNELAAATSNPNGSAGTDENRFITAVSKITSETIRANLDNKMSGNPITGEKSLQDLINFEFKGGSSDDLYITENVSNPPLTTTYGGKFKTQIYRIVDRQPSGSFAPLQQIPKQLAFNKIQYIFPTEDVANLIYLYKLIQVSKNVFDIEVNLTNSSKGTNSTLSNRLNASGVSGIFNSSIDTDIRQASEFVLKVLEGKITSDYNDSSILNTIEIYTFTSDWKISSITIKPKSATSSGAQTAAIVLNIDNAISSIEVLKDLPRDFFYGNVNGLDELATIENIYVNLNYLYRQAVNTNIEIQDSKEKNEINLYSYIKSIMSGIQSAIGNINNFEIHVDPVDNYVARIIDVNYTGNDKIQNLFTLEVHNTKSTVRSYSLQSQIFPNQSSIIAIGSQAQGGQLGIQNNTMIDFNNQIRDRIIPKKTAGKTDDLDNNNYIVTNSIASIIQLLAVLSKEDSAATVNISDLISKAKNSLRDIIVYFQRIFDSDGGRRNIIPIQFSFEMDGIGGLIIGNLFKINQDILPRGYKGRTLAQTVTRIAHSISNNDWTTKIDALNIILEKKSGTFNIKSITSILGQALKNAIGRALPSLQSVPGSPVPLQLGPCGALLSGEIPVRASNIDVNYLITAIINNIEGGYYDPATHFSKLLPKDQKVFATSGETMFGVDLVNGAGYRNADPVAWDTFWSDIWTAQGYTVKGKIGSGTGISRSGTASNPWKQGEWKNLPVLFTDKLYRLAASFMSKNADIFFKTNKIDPNLEKLIKSDGRLYYNFLYAVWNGYGWFEGWTKYISQKYASGITSSTELTKLFVEDRRRGGIASIPNANANAKQLTSQGGQKICRHVGPL